MEALQEELSALKIQLAQLTTANEAAAASNNGAIPAISNATQNAYVAAYKAPKIAPFIRSNPSIWFTQAEITMRNAGIEVSATMADFVAEKLDADALMCVIDLLGLKPRPADLYEQVKARILSALGGSNEQRFRQLLKGQVSLEGQPSLVLNRMKTLDPGVGTPVLKSIFLEQLTPNCRAALAISGIEDVNELAKAADKYMDSLASEIPQVFSVNSSDQTVLLLKELKTQLDQLTARVDTLSVSGRSYDQRARPQYRNRSNSRTREKSRNSSASRNNSQSAGPPASGNQSLCYLHAKFGNKAYRCRGNCSWSASQGN